jgi:hypothetical protein
MAFGVVALAWMLWSYLTTEKVIQVEAAPEVNPYQAYNATLATPAPDIEMNEFINATKLFFAMPGWTPVHFAYAKGTISAAVQSSGGSTQDLFQWATDHNATLNIQQDGVFIVMSTRMPSRVLPKTIYPVKQVIGTLVDKIAIIYPGNNLKLDAFDNKGVFTDVTITISVTSVSPTVVALIGNQFKDLPVALQSVALDVENGNFSGTIIIHALGS